MSVCHCLACQQRTGSVFGVVARFPAALVSTRGESREYVRAGDEGSRATFHFCPVCGATVYYVSDAVDGAVMVPVGAFADPQFPGPTISVYEQRKHAWVTMPPDITHVA
ncbi:GFA family protein [Oleiagrimonas sp. C23AA]|uniref:GFA family protein n=1 Tax=Oleiagrimonas sp. C23AA TaxID=2719047 RepID=UPI0031B727EB